MRILHLVKDVSILQHRERDWQLCSAHPHVNEAKTTLRGAGLVHVPVRVDHDQAGGDQKAHSARNLKKFWFIKAWSVLFCFTVL